MVEVLERKEGFGCARNKDATTCSRMKIERKGGPSEEGSNTNLNLGKILNELLEQTTQH